jgi:hypothetical protein
MSCQIGGILNVGKFLLCHLTLCETIDAKHNETIDAQHNAHGMRSMRSDAMEPAPDLSLAIKFRNATPKNKKTMAEKGDSKIDKPIQREQNLRRLSGQPLSRQVAEAPVHLLYSTNRRRD